MNELIELLKSVNDKIDYENEKYETNPFIFVIIMVEIKRAIS